MSEGGEHGAGGGHSGGKDLRKITDALAAGDEASIIHMKTLHLGPDELLVAAKIAVSHGDTAEGIARETDAAGQRIREAAPSARVIYLEPDIRRSDAAPVTGAGAPPA